MPDTLVSVLVAAMRDRIGATSDGFVRVDLPPAWPVSDALEKLREELSVELRVAVLEPFVSVIDLSAFSTATTEPNVVTRWRNEAGSQSQILPTVILGSATGPKEAGLRRVSQVIQVPDILREWEQSLRKNFSSLIPSRAMLPLIPAIVELVAGGGVDALAADEYFHRILERPQSFDATARELLWTLELVPDSRILDKGRAKQRLRLNQEFIEDVLSVGGNPQADRRLLRLAELARDGVPAAISLSAFRESRDSAALRGIDLAEILGLLDAREQRNPTTRALDLFGLLDNHAAIGADVSKIFETLAKQWRLSIASEQHLEASALDDVRFAFEVTPIEHDAHDPIRRLYATENAAVEVLFRASPTNALELRAGEEPRDVDPQELVKRVGAGLNRDEGAALSRLAEAYVEARQVLLPNAVWFSDPRTTLAALVLFPELSGQVRRFLDAWTELVTAARPSDARVGDATHNTALMLESVVSFDDSNNFISCRLGPLHPYRLDPVLKIADHINVHLRLHSSPDGDDFLKDCRVGEQVRWGLEHAIPAFSNLSISRNDLHLTATVPDIVFEDRTSRAPRHAMDSSGGMEATIASFLGIHPYAEHGLSILVINPPPGNGALQSLVWVANRYSGARIFVVTESSHVFDPSPFPETVNYVGHFKNLDEVLAHFGQKTHLTFLFGLGHNTLSVSSLSRGPVGGIGISPTVELSPQQLFIQSDEDALEPRIFFQPRSANRVVTAFASRNDERISIFGVPLMLSRAHEEFASTFAERCEWMVLAAPFPLSTLPPQVLLGGARFIGRESQGQFSFFVYSSSMYATRRLIQRSMQEAPLAVEPTALEREIERLATLLPGGIMRMGRSSTANTVTEQIGLIAAIQVAGLQTSLDGQMGVNHA